jgi:hypothetical protein
MTKTYCRTLPVESFNQLLDELELLGLIIEPTVERVTVSFKHEGTEYQTSLTGDLKDIPNVGTIWNQFLKNCERETFELKNKEQYGYKETWELLSKKKHVKWDIKDPGGYSYTLDKKARKWLKCWSYDVNSAYSYAMLQDMPDTDQPPRLNDFVHAGEIGFTAGGEASTEEGDYMEFIFPLKESPFKAYVNKYYDKKKEATNDDERAKWKYFLNIPSGMMQKHNIFMRLAILHYAKIYISSFIDEDTVYCNVDSIISTKERTDLPLGDKLGEFKKSKENADFKYIQPGIYQWGSECHYQGIPGQCLTDIEDTTGWQDNYKYKLVNRRLVKNEKN